jgi:Rps23 Pro-64 3,4-dihydroxylase Tpa1-like proline 4-hydroxylase
MPLRLKKQGYTWFELSEFDPEFYNWLLPLKCNKDTNLKNEIKDIRINMIPHADIPNSQIQETFETFEEAYKRKNEIINDYKNITKFSQIFYETHPSKLFESVNLNIEDYKKYIGKMVTHFYSFDNEQKYADTSYCTYYDTDCFLQNHSDGTGTGRVCAILIYLNEEYDENDGGLLILDNNEKIIPKFGRVVIIDLQSFDIPHEVTKVINGLGRFALLSFVKKKENEFINY